MSVGLRMLLILILLAVVVTLISWMVRDSQPEGTTPIRWESSRQCEECHQEVYREWHGSHHQIAYLNPEVRALSDDFRNKECQACHLPRPVSVTGYAQRSLPRMTLPDEGVSCLTCHLGADGGILGRVDRADAPCRPRASPELLSTEMCESCHNQHATTDQYRASPFAKAGGTCRECHMPELERTTTAGVRAGFMHVYKGCHDLETLQSAGKFVVTREGNELVLSLTNVAAGHNFPTEERHRAVDMMVRFETAPGEWGEWERAYRFRQPYRDETGPDTQLPAGETKTVRVDWPAGASKAQARLWYRLTPYVTDDDPRSTLLFEEEVAAE
ncbi:MAG: multiheme c-type cytochrome [Planctomycetota bacterium]